MTYATAMVSLAVDQPNEALLEVSGQLAALFSAKVIGVAAAMFSPPMYFLEGAASQQLFDEGEAAIQSRMTELESRFRAAMHGRVKALEWRSAMELPARYVAREARAADLVIVGGDGNAILDPFAIASPSDLVLQLGRPLLVVPSSAKWLDLRSALVAWKDCPEARRAVADALPLLARVKEVTGAAVAEQEGTQATAWPPIPAPAWWWPAPMAARASANGCWAASPSTWLARPPAARCSRAEICLTQLNATGELGRYVSLTDSGGLPCQRR